MKSKKTKIILCIITCCIALISVGLKSNAFFTSKDRVNNDFKIGHYEVKTRENFDPKNDVFDKCIKKEVYVENTGTVPSYVRVKVVPFWKNGMPIKIDGKDTVIFEYEKSNNWIKYGDFYYYRKILNPGEKTDILLKAVTANKIGNKEFSNNVNSNYNIDNLAVDVFTESVIKTENTKLNNERLKEYFGKLEKDFIS